MKEIKKMPTNTSVRIFVLNIDDMNVASATKISQEVGFRYRDRIIWKKPESPIYGIAKPCIGFIERLRKDLHSKNQYERISASRFFHVNPKEVQMLRLMSEFTGLTPAEVRRSIKKGGEEEWTK